MGRKKSDPEQEFIDQLERDRARYKADPRIGKLVKAARKGDAKRVAALLAEGADPNAPEVTEWSWDPPITAAIVSRNPEVVRLLAKAGANLNVGFPYTALGQSIAIKEVGLVKALIEGGADVNATAENGDDTPLDIAVSENQAEIVGMLLDAGADPHLVTRRSKNARSGRSPLQSAGDVGRKAVLAEFVKRGLVKGKGASPLRLCAAAADGDLAEVRRLVQAGADVNAANGQGAFPLAEAALHGRLNVVKFLLANGADVNPPKRDWAERDSSPLVGAVLSGKLPVVEAIVNAGGLSTFDDALDYAKHCRLKKITDYLLAVKTTSKVKKASPASEPKPRRTGVPTFDVNDACLLVEASVASVAKAWRDQIGARTWKRGVLGETVKLAAASFAVFRLKGQPWSVVMRLSGENPYAHLQTLTAGMISATLKARAMLVSFGDTSGVYRYVTFRDGDPVEVFDTGTAGDETNRAAVAIRFRKACDVDLGGFRDVRIAQSCTFASALRKPTLPKGKNPLEFIEEHLARENAFVPFFGDATGRRGERCELTLEGFGPDDIERLDYVAV